jgi:hypothetical protein
MSFKTPVGANQHRRYISIVTQAECPLVAPDLGEWRGSAASTNATPQNATLYSPTASQVLNVKFRASAIKSDGSKGATWEIVAAVRSNASGVLSLLGATTLSAEADSSFAPTAEVNVSGANIIAILTGIAATDINWSFETEIA